jgi:hypothetical protein
MLFQVDPNTPRFEVFTVLNQELLSFVKGSQVTGDFRRTLFTAGPVGQACWENAKENNARATNDLTKEKFEKFFNEIQKLGTARRTELYECIKDNQDLSEFFTNPHPELMDGFPAPLKTSFKNLASHLYTSTKGLQAIIDHCGVNDINAHFQTYQRTNGNVCKACGMHVLSPLRVNVQDEDQWRADYDHQLCKSKYPLYAVHPDNLIPLCDVCNQDAKKSKNLFKGDNGHPRLSFYPYEESCNEFIQIEVANLRDPEIDMSIEWLSEDEDILNKLGTWDDVYEIRNLVLGRYYDLSSIIIDAINPTDSTHMKSQIAEKSREPNALTYSRQPWTFWEHKFFSKLNQLDNDDLEALWSKVEFILEQGEIGVQEIEHGA